MISLREPFLKFTDNPHLSPPKLLSNELNAPVFSDKFQRFSAFFNAMDFVNMNGSTQLYM